jgi:DME family drug/metabolite transporter
MVAARAPGGLSSTIHSGETLMNRGVLFVAVAAIAWGSGGVVATVLYRTSGLGPVAVSCWRLVLGLAILAALDGLRKGRARSALDWRTTVATGIGLAISQTAYFGAVALAGVALATVVTIGAGPVLVAFGGRYALGERLRPAALAATGAALVGLVLLVTGGAHTGTGSAPTWGIGLALLSAATYAAVTLLARYRGEQGDPSGAARGSFAVGALVLLPLALVEGMLPTTGHLGGTVGWLLYLGAVPTALGYGLFFAGLAAVRATTAAVVALLEPVTAAVAAMLLLGERLTVVTVVGTGILLAAVAGLAAAERDTAERDAAERDAVAPV